MKFALVTAYDEAYKPLADLTWENNKKLYAQRWGYDTYTVTEGFTSLGDISWARTRKVVELLESGYDWVHAVGCDTMITNFNIRLEDLVDANSDFIIAADCLNINNDSYLAHNTENCINWLKYLDTLQDQYCMKHPWNDQQCMIDNIERLGDGLKIVPQKLINSYDYDLYPGIIPHIFKKDLFGNDGQWQVGDFLIHWPAVALDKRIQLAHNMMEQVVK